MKAILFLLASCLSFFVLPDASAQKIMNKPGAPSAKMVKQYKVCLYRQGAKIEIDGKQIYLGQIFTDPKKLKFFNTGDWVNTFIVGSSNKGEIFTYTCETNPCQVLTRAITAAQYKLETTDPRELMKKSAATAPTTTKTHH